MTSSALVIRYHLLLLSHICGVEHCTQLIFFADSKLDASPDCIDQKKSLGGGNSTKMPFMYKQISVNRSDHRDSTRKRNVDLLFLR